MSTLPFRPVFFEGFKDPKLQKLLESKEPIRTVDIFEDSLKELFDIEHPWLKSGNSIYDRSLKAYLDEWRKEGPFEEQGVWIYYPWSRILTHFPSADIYYRLRTSRNRNLITEEEQQSLRGKRIGIAGMSVGSNILNTIVLTGTSQHLKIADYDTISVPNLNRIQAPAYAVGMNKAQYFTQKSLETDPFLEIETYDKGLNEADFDSFFTEPRLDLFIEEMDNPYLKVQSRKRARALGIPVIMAADNGDGALIDVERFDLEPDRPLFHGRLDHLDLDSLKPQLSFAEKLTLIASMAGLAEATPRMQNSIEEVGSSLNTWPQLGTAALTAGITLTYVARRILLGLPMPSGRYRLNLEDSLVPGYNSFLARKSRAFHTEEIMYGFTRFQRFLKHIGKL